MNEEAERWREKLIPTLRLCASPFKFLKYRLLQ